MRHRIGENGEKRELTIMLEMSISMGPYSYINDISWI